MPTPVYIRSVSDVASFLVLGTTTEGMCLDFKATIPHWKAPKGTPEAVRHAAQKELCRDVAQFANTDGGVLIIGVRETTNADGIKVATGIDSVSDPDDMRAWIEQAIANYLVPSTFSREIHFVTDTSGTLVAINVPPSIHTVYLFDSGAGTIEVVGRTNHGKRLLNPDELERHIMNGSRAKRLALEEAIATARTQDIVLLGGVLWLDDKLSKSAVAGAIRIGQRTSSWFELCIPIIRRAGITSLTVPYGLLREAWVDAAGRVNVLLHVAVGVLRGELQLLARD